jgi:hypothetical protein
MGRRKKKERKEDRKKETITKEGRKERATKCRE